MPVLQIRDKNGKFIPIPAVKGNDGKSAYEQAKEGGYTGTEEEFIALLNGLTSTEDAAHYSDFNNPHKVTKDQVGLGNVENVSITAHTSNKANPHEVTASQTGAIPEVYYASNDLNTEIQQGGNKMTVCSYHSGTLNTPYKAGLTMFAHGMVITNANSNQYGTQLCMPSGENAVYVRTLNGSGVTQWLKLADNENIDFLTTQVDVLHDQIVSFGEVTQRTSGTYKGTGTYGTNNPNTLTFDFTPLFVMVSKRGSSSITSGNAFMWIYPEATLCFNNNGSSYWVYPSVNGGTFSWYSTQSSSYQLNQSNNDYDYIAWG